MISMAEIQSLMKDRKIESLKVKKICCFPGCNRNVGQNLRLLCETHFKTATECDKPSSTIYFNSAYQKR